MKSNGFTTPGAQLKMTPDAPEPEQTHAVLAGNDLPCSLLRGQAALARVTDVRRQVVQGVLARQLGDDALTVITNDEHVTPRCRRRTTRMCPVWASSEFCTSSATAFRGSLWLRASQRMRSNGSAGRRRTVLFRRAGTGRCWS
jgi:hypothetical protein